MSIDTSIDTGGSAFPTMKAGVGVSVMILDGGMSLRDYLAAKALQGLVASPHWNGRFEPTARDAYALADAMLNVRGDK